MAIDADDVGEFFEVWQVVWGEEGEREGGGCAEFFANAGGGSGDGVGGIGGLLKDGDGFAHHKEGILCLCPAVNHGCGEAEGWWLSEWWLTGDFCGFEGAHGLFRVAGPQDEESAPGRGQRGEVGVFDVDFFGGEDLGDF